MTSTDREFDVILFGATGFVGDLVAADLAAHAPAGTRIALAGRTRSKVETVRQNLGANAAGWGIVAADSNDEASLRALAESTRVVISTVGPYARHGLPLVGACANSGTHYVDLTGEVLFARDCIDHYDEAARASGARIVNSCGYDSVPSDLSVFLAAEAAREAGDGELEDTTVYASMKGGMSGGTVASAMQQADDIASQPERRKIAGDKFSLSPERSSEPKGEYKDSLKVAYSDDIKAWTAPFLMASYNTRIVRRSNALFGHGYGKTFRYREVMKAGTGLKGRVRAFAIAGALAAGFTALANQKARPVVERFVPKPGTGPDEKSRVNGFFRMDLRTTTTTGAHYRSIVAAQGDPGYNATAVMLAEAALTLSEGDLPKLPTGADGGVLTPAVALGMPYVERLRARDFTLTATKLA
jgi:short subunit dehydrogenase-like uncharacterized protein